MAALTPGLCAERRFVDELEKLGYRLHLFQRACNLLYQLSVKGKQPAWVAAYLDAGKPPELVALSRERIFRDEIARSSGRTSSRPKTASPSPNWTACPAASG